MIIFENKGEIDPRAITVMGLSAKEGDNPIGRFGTGLKYAIAVLLREGQSVQVRSGSATYDFTTRPDTFRGQNFDFVYMNEHMLGFTTELGKDWELWMALRELYCNALDEGGRAYRAAVASEFATPHTQVLVSGRAFDETFDRLGEFILQSTPLVTSAHANIHAGASKAIFYRGMRVRDEVNCLYTYNVGNRIDLTEDRTAKYNFQLDEAVIRTVLELTHKGMLEEILRAEKGTYEHDLCFTNVSKTPSAEFLEVAEDLMKRKETMNESAKGIVFRHKEWLEQGKEATVTEAELKMIAKAVQLLTKAGFDIQENKIKVFATLGEGILGTIQSNEIHLSKLCLNMGQRIVTGTILEEFLHITRHLYDCSRGLQNFLVDAFVGQLEERHWGERSVTSVPNNVVALRPETTDNDIPF
jgi:hypothetical protein